MRKMTSSCSRTLNFMARLPATHQSKNAVKVEGACSSVPSTFTGACTPFKPSPGMRAKMLCWSDVRLSVDTGTMRG